MPGWTVLYLATTSGPKVRDAMLRHPDWLGQMLTPDTGNAIIGEPVQWAADNGAFASWLNGTPFDFDRWADWLAGQPTSAMWAVVPDVVEDHDATIDQWITWAPLVRDLGHRPAFVLQNGCTPSAVPADADVVFVGGDTDWKLGPTARAIVGELRSRCWVHMGRVNSLRRLLYAAAIGCDSVDGTYLAFGPDRNLPTLLGWLRRVNAPTLWEASA